MRKVQTIYISGPMTGIPDLNFPAFHAAAQLLRRKGLDTINPAEVNPDSDASRYVCLRHDLAALTQCDAVALLPGWEHSPRRPARTGKRTGHGLHRGPVGCVVDT